MDKNSIKILAEELLNSNYTVVLTGAGMSTESRLADFRSREGIWKKFDPMKVASIDSLRNDYENFHGFYSMRAEKRVENKPHRGHYILASWEEKGIVHGIVTQNVENFHKQAGSRNIYNLHGAIDQFMCSDCRESADLEDFLEMNPCRACGGRLRPGIVLFGEQLPYEELEGAIDEIEKAELVIIIGTSLTVYPAAGLHSRTKGKVVYINDEHRGRDKFDLVIEGKAGEVLIEVNKILENEEISP